MGRRVLGGNKEVLAEINVPRPPVLDFPLITRRIAAQRSRFIVFGTDANWLAEDFKREDMSARGSGQEWLHIDAGSRPRIRQQMRDCGVTESVIYPDLDGLGREMT